MRCLWTLLGILLLLSLLASPRARAQEDTPSAQERGGGQCAQLLQAQVLRFTNCQRDASQTFDLQLQLDNRLLQETLRQEQGKLDTVKKQRDDLQKQLDALQPQPATKE